MSSRERLILAPLVILFTYGISVACPVDLRCDCSTLDPAQSFRAEDSVFVGRVVSIEKKPFGEIVNFEVRRSLNGDFGDTVSLYQDPSNCDVQFEKNKRYLVYARSIGGRLSASSCSKTKVLNSYARLRNRFTVQQFITSRQHSYSQIALITFASVTLSISLGFLLPRLVRRRWRGRTPEIF